MTVEFKKRLGRPPLSPSKKRGHTMGFKPTPEINKQLRDAAAANDRSVSKEIEARLERSFSNEEALYDEFGGWGGYEIFRVLGTAASALGMMSGKKHWWHEPHVFDLLAKEVCPALLGVFKKEVAKKKRVDPDCTSNWTMELNLADPTDDGSVGKYRRVYYKKSSMKF